MIWIGVLRPHDGHIVLTEVWTLTEVAQRANAVELRLRYNPDMHPLIMRLPDRTSREQVFSAFDHLTCDERRRLYALRQHPLMETRHVR